MQKDNYQMSLTKRTPNTLPTESPTLTNKQRYQSIEHSKQIANSIIA